MSKKMFFLRYSVIIFLLTALVACQLSRQAKPGTVKEQECFVLTGQSFEKIKNRRSIADSVFNELKNLENRKFDSEKEFSEALNKEIGFLRAFRHKKNIMECAEKCPSDSRGFEITDRSLDILKKQRFSEYLLSSLGKMKNQFYQNEDEFLQALTEKIGKKYAEAYKSLILKVADTEKDSPGKPEKALAKHYIIGRSVEGRPVYMSEIGAGKDVILFMASVAGDEKAGKRLTDKLETYLKDSSHLFEGRKILLISEMNPDGIQRNTRKNANGIYLNNNFPGGYGRIQPETEAVRKIIRKKKINRIVSIRELQSIDYDGPSRDLAEHMKTFCNLKIEKLGTSPGSLGSYAGEKLGIPTVTFGLHNDAGSLDPEQLWKRYGDAVMAAIVYPDAAPAGPEPTEISNQKRPVQKRLALVIGNSAYKYSPLDNPVRDAKLMESNLKYLGFDVDKYENMSRDAMYNAIDSFGKKLRNYDVGLFFYAGHGIQIGNDNYLIPSDSPRLRGLNHVKRECVRAEDITGEMEDAGSRFNIVILDACRDNPFRSWSRGTATRGLASMSAPPGTLIAYSTAPGETALDESIYIDTLLKHMRTQDITILELFQMVRKTVMEKTSNKQIPWEATSLTDAFYFRRQGQ